MYVNRPTGSIKKPSNLSGLRRVHSILPQDAEGGPPVIYGLVQNYPNPFNYSAGPHRVSKKAVLLR